MLSPSSFFTIKGSYFFKDFNEYLLTNHNPAELKDLIAKAEYTSPVKDDQRMKVTQQGVKKVFTVEDISYKLAGIKETFVLTCCI